MIYLQEGNFPLNEAFSSEIVQEANSTYQLTFKFPTSDPKWALLTPETELVADDLHGEQYFTIFEVEKQHGYVTVYANQVATLLNGYSINKINVDRVNGATVMNALVAGFKRETPFTFFSDVMSKHTLNLKDISAMEALAKDKHSIVGQWGGDLVRDKYSVRLLENGGIENESLFAYKKNMKSFQESKSTKELRTRIHFKKVIEAHEEGKKDQILTVTIDSPLINKYKHIYEADMEVQDQDVVDQKTLEEYGKRYFRETLCDMIEESLEIDVVGQADQPVHMFDIVSLFHEIYNVDLRKKITKYKFNPMSIKLVSIGFGEVTRTLADSISGMVNDSVDKKMKSYDAEYEAKVQKLVDNANAEYDKQAKELEHKITDGIEQAKAQAEVVKQEISAKVTEKINAANQANKNEIVEEFKAQYNGIEVKMQGLKATTDQLKTSDADIQKLVNDFKAQTQSQFSGIQGAQSRFEQTTEKAISDLTNVANGKADRSYVEQTVNGLKEEFTSLKVGSRNYAEDYDFTRGLWFFTHGDSSNSTGTAENGVYTITGNTNTWKQAQLFSSTAPSWATSKTTALDYLEKGEPYTISFYAKRNSGSGVMWASLRENRKSGGNPERITAKFQLTDDWQLYKVSVPALEKSDEFYFWRIIIGYSEAGSISFKKVELTQSTTRTDAGPAPEDQKYLVEQAKATFEKTVQGLTTQLTRLETKTGPNGEFEQRMLTYSEKAAVDAVKATRQILEQGYVSKSQYTEDVSGINRRFETISTSTDSKINSKLAEFKQGIDGQFSTFSTEFGMRLSSQNSVLNDKLDDFKDSINGRFANYQQTVNGQVATIISQFDGVLKKTDINITDGQISFGTGKSINGRTISSLLVQEPESIALIARLIKVKGDMVVDGSILGRHIASESVETGHMKAGSVTTPILASNAVTADKLLVDSAMISKLVSNQAFIRELTSQKAFITQLASIDFSAERIKGGRLESNTGALVFDLDKSAMNMLTDTAVIRRVFNNFPTQFIRYGTHIENGNRFSKTIIGSNRDGTENSGNRTFSGIEIYNSTNEDVEDYTKFYADKLYLQHSEYKQGWIIQNAGKPRIAPLNGTTYSEIIASDFRMIYTADGNHRSVGTYLWDLLTCFGILQKYGWDLKNSAAQRHIGGVLSKYNYR
jgi:phage minor structural protein, N-terminal domain protein